MGLRVRHLNCGTMCPYGRRFVEGEGGPLSPARMVCHVLLVETDRGLVLVDTGLGLDDVAQGRRRLGPVSYVIRPRFDPAETAWRQIEDLGYDPNDVRDVVITHLDLDHAGGLADFPQARVHLLRWEHEAAKSPRSLLERHRYRTQQWAHGPDWRTYEPQGERWHGLECVRQLEGLPPEILLVPLPGHTRGHTGVAVETPDRWLLHCGDAYFFRAEVEPDTPWCPSGLRLFQRLSEEDRARRLRSQQRLRELVGQHDPALSVFCAHDPHELAPFV